MKKLFYLIPFLIGCGAANTASQKAKPVANEFVRPKLIIGITVDQMRYDYIEKYWSDFGDNGFKKMVNEGFFSRNVHYNYMPTYTGPGHASIFTGTTPTYHGIVANDWYERSRNRMTYCSADSTVTGVGTQSNAGKMSPHYLLSSTIGDELQLFTNQRSKVIGIALKDRGAILPAGRAADAAYWFVGANEGIWATSSWYKMTDLPQWVKSFNQNGKAESYMNQTWSLLKDSLSYDESVFDNNAHEAPFKGGTMRPVFPYDLKALREANGNFEMIKATPFGNSLTLDFAKAAIEGEQMGKDNITDMLCLSFSSTDYVGHQFGIHARETQDVYLRLDLIMADFISYLDQTVGKGNYLIFLSADHGGAPTPSCTAKQNAAGGYWQGEILREKLSSEMAKKYGAGEWISNITNQNIFLNRKLIEEKGLDLGKIQDEVSGWTSENEQVLMSISAKNLNQYSVHSPIASLIQMGYHQGMSGDVIFVTNPGIIDYGRMGTTHGSPFSYDTHVPAIFYGMNIKGGETFSKYNVTDIAATVAALCRIPFPSACTGVPMNEVVNK